MKASRVISTRRTARWVSALAVASLALPAATYPLEPGSDERSITRRPDGRPDLTGTYDIATLTPVERPPEYGDKLTLTDEEAGALGNRELQLRALRNRPSDPDREAPPEGGDGSPGAAGNVVHLAARPRRDHRSPGDWRTYRPLQRSRSAGVTGQPVIPSPVENGQMGVRWKFWNDRLGVGPRWPW